MDGTRQYMSPENIIRPAEDRGILDLQTADLSKVDTFGLGVILINMLTGNYLFESCLAEGYDAIVTDKHHLASELRKKIPNQIEDAELEDLSSLLQAMLNPETDERLSIKALLECELPETRWLQTALHRCNGEQEIAAEMKQRVHQGGSLGEVLTYHKNEATGAQEQSEPTFLHDQHEFDLMPEYEHFSYF